VRQRLGADGYAYFMGLLNYMMCCTNANPRSFDKFDLEAAQERHDIFEKIIIKHDLYAVLEKGRVWTLLVCVNLILTLVLVVAKKRDSGSGSHSGTYDRMIASDNEVQPGETGESN
jgi:hypothetical protein